MAFTLRIGSRGSELARWQAEHIKSLLEKTHPDITVTITIITTTGDRDQNSSLTQIGGKGVFTKEIEEALIDGSIDLAVHSLKDLPTELDSRLTVACVPERANVHDVFLSKDKNARLADLPDGATVATGSLRRKAQLLVQRPDFRIHDIRGNVPTRIKKLLDSNWDGMLLAAAGVERLGLTEYVAHEVTPEWILPAVGQGALGIETRTDDKKTIEYLNPLMHEETLQAVTAERKLLEAMGGGCQVPLGALGRIVGDILDLSACVANPDGSSVVKGSHTGPKTEAARIGSELAKTLLANGAGDILARVYRLQTPEIAVNPHPAV